MSRENAEVKKNEEAPNKNIYSSGCVWMWEAVAVLAVLLVVRIVMAMVVTCNRKSTR